MEQPDRPPSKPPSAARKVGVYRAPEKSLARGRLPWIIVAAALAVIIGLFILFAFVF